MSRIRSHQLMDLAAMAALAAEATERHEASYSDEQRKSTSPTFGSQNSLAKSTSAGATAGGPPVAG